MTYELDEEFVMQMEDSILFKWLSTYGERFISCMEKSEFSIGEIVAEGNGFTYSRIFLENISKGKTNEEGHRPITVFITISGENSNILEQMRNYNDAAIIISQGGNAKKIAREKNWFFFSLPKGIPARFMFPEVLGCLSSIDGIKIDTNKVQSIVNDFVPSNPTESNFAKKLGYAMARDFIISVDKDLRGIRRRIEDMTLQNVNYIPRIVWKDQLNLYMKGKDEKGIIEVNSNYMSIKDPMDKINHTLENLDLPSLINVLDYATVYLAILKKHDILLLDNYRE